MKVKIWVHSLCWGFSRAQAVSAVLVERQVVEASLWPPRLMLNWVESKSYSHRDQLNLSLIATGTSTALIRGWVFSWPSPRLTMMQALTQVCLTNIQVSAWCKAKSSVNVGFQFLLDVESHYCGPGVGSEIKPFASLYVLLLTLRPEVGGGVVKAASLSLGLMQCLWLSLQVLALH
jgi:hypothetical protein